MKFLVSATLVSIMMVGVLVSVPVYAQGIASSTVTLYTSSASGLTATTVPNPYGLTNPATGNTVAQNTATTTTGGTTATTTIPATTTPGLPATGNGGEMAANIALLAASLLGVGVGVWVYGKTA